MPSSTFSESVVEETALAWLVIDRNMSLREKGASV
jgi:hypothetical protein